MPGIWGDGQRGGIFGAKVDPRLQAELERRADIRRSYTTALSPTQELKFRDWKQRFAPDDSGEDYDLRGAFKAGFQPDPETGHWPDVYKKPNHPTFSNQSIYARDRPDLAGSWDGDTYVSTPLRRHLDVEAEREWQAQAESQAYLESLDRSRPQYVPPARNLDPSQIPPREMPQSFDETLTGTIGDVVYGAPVIGPAALGLGARLGAAGQALQGKQDYSQALEDIQTKQEQFRRLNPGISGSAQGGGSSLFAPAFGGSLPAQMLGNAAIGGADAMVRGDDPYGAAGAGAVAAIVPIPGAKGALKKGVRELKSFSPYSKLGQDIPVTETAPIYVPGSGPKLIEKTFDPATLKPGDRIVGFVGDRSHTGEDLGGIRIGDKEVKFKKPVQSEGGAGYMSHEYNPQDAVWASNQGPTTTQAKRLSAHLENAEGDVYGATLAMAAPGIDFSVQATRTALETLGAQPLTKEAREALYDAIDEAMAAPIGNGKDFPAIPDWPGVRKFIKDGRHLQAIPGKWRAKLMKRLDADPLKQLGAPNMAAVRYAVTAPGQRNASVLESGHGWFKMGSEAKRLSPEEVIRGHKTYPWVTSSPGGEYAGTQPMPVELVFPGLARKVRHMNASGQQRTASMQDVYEVVTPRQLERFQRWLESEKGKQLGVAGAVAAGLLTAAQADALFGEDQTDRPKA